MAWECTPASGAGCPAFTDDVTVNKSSRIKTEVIEFMEVSLQINYCFPKKWGNSTKHLFT